MMMHSFYHDDYSYVEHPKVKKTLSNLTIHAMVYRLAEKYDVKGLRELSLAKFQYAISAGQSAQDLYSAAGIAYSTIPEDMRDIRDLVISTLAENRWTLETEKCNELLRTTPNLTYDLLMYIACPSKTKVV